MLHTHTKHSPLCILFEGKEKMPVLISFKYIYTKRHRQKKLKQDEMKKKCKKNQEFIFYMAHVIEICIQIYYYTQKIYIIFIANVLWERLVIFLFSHLFFVFLLWMDAASCCCCNGSLSFAVRYCYYSSCVFL